MFGRKTSESLSNKDKRDTTNSANSSESDNIKSTTANKSSSKQQESTTPNSKEATSKEALAATKTGQQQQNETLADKQKKFENEGVSFKAKLIGSELVMEPRGDKMCQNSIQRLKAIIKGTSSHKRRITLKISYDGVKVYDEKSNEMLHHHEVSQISYIAGDDTDDRTFGYVSDVPSKAHQFICFKTSGPAINVMSTISALFEAVLERKKETSGKGSEQSQQQVGKDGVTEVTTKVARQDSIDLIGDSGIMEGDSSMASINSPPGGVKEYKITNKGGDRFDKNSNSMLDSLVMASSPADSFNAAETGANKIKQQSSVDLIFDDLFTGLSDPIIVDRNDSLISYKGNKSVGAGGGGAGAAGLMQPPASLPRPAPLFPPHMGQSTQGHNRSLVYNHSSVSLSDAALTRQSSFNAIPASVHNKSYNHQQAASQQQHQQQQQQQHSSQHRPMPTRSISVSAEPNADRYAVFNDIDNLPSIFESTSLSSVNNLSNQMMNNIGTSLSDIGSHNSNHQQTAAMINNFASSSAAAFNNFASMSASMGQHSSSLVSHSHLQSHPQQQPQQQRHHYQQQQQHFQQQPINPMNSGNSSMNFGAFGGFNYNNNNNNSFSNSSANANQFNFINSNNGQPMASSAVNQQRSSSSINIHTNSSNVFRQTNPFDDDFFS